MTSTDRTSTGRMQELAAPALAAVGLELWDIEAGPDLIRILVDRAGGVDLDALTQATAAVSSLLDAHPELTPPGHYQLEVSSPGIERTLRTTDHFQRYLGETVTIKTTVSIDGTRRWQGRLQAADAEGITLAAGGGPAPGRTVKVRLDQIARAKTVLDWGSTPKPKGPAPKSGRPASIPSSSSGEPPLERAGAGTTKPKDNAP